MFLIFLISLCCCSGVSSARSLGLSCPRSWRKDSPGVCSSSCGDPKAALSPLQPVPKAELSHGCAVPCPPGALAVPQLPPHPRVATAWPQGRIYSLGSVRPEERGQHSERLCSAMATTEAGADAQTQGQLFQEGIK